MRNRAQENEWPLEIKSGSAVVKIYRTEKASGYVSYTAVYYKGRERMVRFFQELAEAKTEARKIANEITQGEHIRLDLTANDKLAIERAREILAPLNIAIDVACGEYAESLRALGGTGSILEACRDFAKRNSTGLTKITVADAVEKLIEQARTDGKSEQRQNRIASLLGRFAKSFNVEVHTLTPKLVGDYLAALPFKERTKANHRDMLGYFSRWCVTQRYLPKGTDLLEGVQKYSKRKYGAVEILTPEEMAKLLTHASDELLPFITLCGFAGLRSIEVQRLDWSDIDFEDGFIEVREETAKQHEGEILRRIVPMPANLKAWLLKVKKSSGPVCPFPKVENQLESLSEDSGVEWKHNCLRHSAISYRIAQTGDVPRIADESGNSSYVIRKNYLNRRKPWQAAQWFGIMPADSESKVHLPTPDEAKAIIAATIAPLPARALAA